MEVEPTTLCLVAAVQRSRFLIGGSDSTAAKIGIKC